MKIKVIKNEKVTLKKNIKHMSLFYWHDKGGNVTYINSSGWVLKNMFV